MVEEGHVLLTVIIVLTGLWLLLAPAVMSLGAAAAWTSAIAGILALVLRLVRGGGERSGRLIAAIGVYLIIAGLVFGGAAESSCTIAGAVLAVAGSRVVDEACHGLVPSTRAA